MRVGSEALSAVLDGEAFEADVHASVRHIARCDACLRFVVGVVATTRALRSRRVIALSSARHRR